MLNTPCFALVQTTRWLDEEKQRSDALLYRMLPADIAADLRMGHKVRGSMPAWML
jgi:hypothetical protein